MIKKLLLGGVLAISATAFSQAIPNGGMETWNNQGFYFEPQGWATTNLEAVSGGGTSNVSRVNDAHSGTYAAKLETTVVGDAGEEDTVVGTMLLGNIDLQAQTIIIGAPFTARPDSIAFWYKYTPVNGDKFGAAGGLKSQGGVVATFEFLDGQASATWKRKAIAFEYTSMDPVDTLRVGFGASADTGFPGSVLMIDDISLIYNSTLSAVALKSEEEIKMWPNPAKETLNVRLAKDATIEIYNVLGSKVSTIRSNGTENTEISTADFTNGVYILKTSTGISQRFVVKH